MLEEIDAEPTWRERIPSGLLYVGVLLGIAFATRFLPNDVRDRWRVDPELILSVGASVRMRFDPGRSEGPIELSGLVRWRSPEAEDADDVYGVEFLVPEDAVLERWVACWQGVVESAWPEDIVEADSA